MNDALEFFNRLSGRLAIELSEPPRQVTDKLRNLVASGSARVTAVALTFEVFLGGADFRPLTDDEWSLVVIRSPRLRLRSSASPDLVVEHVAPDAATFTVRDLHAAIVETERRSRDESRWLGGVDVHHAFFEGIDLDGDVGTIGWGS